jgi:hypothetical protein
MSDSQLYRAVARATGETVDLIRSIGFTTLAPIVTAPDEASRWLRRFQHRRRSHRRRHISHQHAGAAG